MTDYLPPPGAVASVAFALLALAAAHWIEKRRPDFWWIVAVITAANVYGYCEGRYAARRDAAFCPPAAESQRVQDGRLAPARYAGTP